MRIAVVTPRIEGVVTGNRRSAEDYAEVFRAIGHGVWVASSWDGEPADVLVALHAAKSAGSVERFRAARPGSPVVVVLTGTDIYPEPGEAALRSMGLADRLVALQDRAPGQVPAELRDRVVVIQHSAAACGAALSQKSTDPFDVCVAGHLRDVKDPMRTAAASRLLPAGSKARVIHVGAVLDGKYSRLIESEERENPRYDWRGGMEPGPLRELIAGCQLSVVSSVSEGGARIVGESIADGTPVLSSEIDGVVGLLGEGYPGYFPVGDTAALAGLMWKVESDPAFRRGLHEAAAAVAPRFDPRRQQGGWARLIDGLAREAEIG